MDKREFNLGLKRRRIEDAIVERYRKVDFKQKQYAWLEDEHFWSFIFAWFDLAKYYEERTDDTAVGAHMLDLYMDCIKRFREAAADKNIRERRRDKATDALYQINYYVNQMMVNVSRNAELSADDPDDHSAGQINWNG